MLSLVTPIIETEVAKEGARGLLTNPWLWANVFLAMIVAAFFASLYLIATKWLPRWEAQQEASRKARAEQHAADLKARAEDKAADRAMMERWVATAVSSAADTAKHAIGVAQKEIGERVADVKDQVNAVHETARQMQRQLAGIAAKTGAPLVVLVLILCFGGGSPAQTQQQLRASQPELARASTGDLAKPTPMPGPVRKDCDPRSCKPPAFCSKGECVGNARKPPPAKLAGSPSSPSSIAVRAAWQDSSPEAFPERLSDQQWLAGL